MKVSTSSVFAPFVAMPGAPFVAFLFLVAMPGAPSIAWFLVVRPGATGSILFIEKESKPFGRKASAPYPKEKEAFESMHVCWRAI